MLRVGLETTSSFHEPDVGFCDTRLLALVSITLEEKTSLLAIDVAQKETLNL